MEGTCKHAPIKTTTDKNCRAGNIEAGASYDDPRVNGGMVPKEMQGPKHLFRTFFLLNHFFPLRSVNTGDPVQQLFIFHLIPSRSSASCQSWHVITTKQDPAFFSFFAAGCAASSEAPWIIYSWGSLGGTPSNSGECLRFSTQPGLPSSLYPFPRVLQERRLEFHGC